MSGFGDALPDHKQSTVIGQPFVTVSVMTPSNGDGGQSGIQDGLKGTSVTAGVANPGPVFQFQVAPNVTPPSNQIASSLPTAVSTNYNNTSPRQQHDPTGFALSDFLTQLEDYTPTIPDAVANHFLHQAGFDSTDPRMTRMISITAQKFISDIINESFTHCKLKGVIQQGKTKAKDKKYVLTLEDLVPVLHDYGITVKKPPYYV